MKVNKLLIMMSLSIFGIGSLFAQNNTLLERSFWKSNPDLEMVKSAVEKGANPSELNSNAFDPAAYAILEQSSMDVIKYLLTFEGNDVNKLTHDLRTYAFWAAYKGNLELLNYLLEKGARTDLKDNKGNSILNFAANAGVTDTRIYDWCITNGIDPTNDFTRKGANAILLVASKKESPMLLKYFQSEGVSLFSKDNLGSGVYDYASRAGNTSLLNDLEKQGCEPTDRALLFAAQGTRNGVVGVDFFTFLKGKGLNFQVVNEDDSNLIQIVSRNSNDLDLMTFFMESGVSANQKNTRGRVALNEAVRYNNLDVVNFLISNGSDVQNLDSKERSIAYDLIGSYNSSREKLFEEKYTVLKKAGFDFDKPTSDGDNLYHLAIEFDKYDLLSWIQGLNIDINHTNMAGETPLHLAVLKSTNTELLHQLIQMGADTSIKTEFGESVYELAMENEQLTKDDLNFLKTK
jgi:ankyrin repeat protein